MTKQVRWCFDGFAHEQECSLLIGKIQKMAPVWLASGEHCKNSEKYKWDYVIHNENKDNLFHPFR